MNTKLSSLKDFCSSRKDSRVFKSGPPSIVPFAIQKELLISSGEGNRFTISRIYDLEFQKHFLGNCLYMRKCPYIHWPSDDTYAKVFGWSDTEIIIIFLPDQKERVINHLGNLSIYEH